MPLPPYDQPGSNIAFWTIFGLFALGEYVVQFRSIRGLIRHDRGARAERWSLAVVLAGVVGGLVGGVKAADWTAARISAGMWPLFILGLVLMVAGLLLRQWAIFVLGRYFTSDVRVQSGQAVVDRGPYRWVRHPSYTGMIIFFVGLGLALSNWASLAVLAVVPTVGLIIRIQSEERALLTGLGDDYRRFTATRARLVPGVW